ncbi:MAG: hypothetical protein ACR2FF_02605 [Mycobacteriales bacterium]|nr:MAG: hypothetical protein DLM56_05590 [Pseudonocardiales bacterium]
MPGPPPTPPDLRATHPVGSSGDQWRRDTELLRKAIRDHHLGYVLQVAANRRVPTHAGPMRVDELAAVPDSAWQRYTCGPGSKGPRYYDWAWIALLPEDDEHTGEHHLLIRRTPGTGELAYPRCYSPHRVPLSTLVRVAGQRWRIEESFQSAKGLVGLDQHQVRRWTSWRRWTPSRCSPTPSSPSPPPSNASTRRHPQA